MQALAEKQRQEKNVRDLLKEGRAIPDRTVEERVQHCKSLQYEKHQQLFVVGYTTVFKAACDNSVAGIKHFMSLRGHRKIDIKALDNQGKSPLHHAAERGSLDVITYLVKDVNLNVNCRTTHQETPLMLACKENQSKAVELLIELGGDIHAVNRAGYTCLHYIAESDRFHCLNKMISIFKPMKKLPEILISNVSKKVSQSSIIKKSSHDDNVDDDGDGIDDNISKLDNDVDNSDNEDDSNSSDSDSDESDQNEDKNDHNNNNDDDNDQQSLNNYRDEDSQMEIGQSYQTLQLSKMRKMKNPFMKTNGGRYFFKLLDTKANNGMTALHLACQINAIATAEILLECGCDVNICDNMLETPLHKAGRITTHRLYTNMMNTYHALDTIENIFHQTPSQLLYDNAKF
jgi:hypothetical protein